MEINTPRKRPDYRKLFAKQTQPDAVYSRPVIIIPVSEYAPPVRQSMHDFKYEPKVENSPYYDHDDITIHRRAIFSGIEQCASPIIRKRGWLARELHSTGMKPGSREQL